MCDQLASDRVQPASGIADSGPSPSVAPFANADERQYLVGPETMARVFVAAGLKNMSDMQAVLDATEAALMEYRAMLIGSRVVLGRAMEVIRGYQAGSQADVICGLLDLARAK